MMVAWRIHVIIDDFKARDRDAFGGFSAGVCERLALRVDALGKRLHVEVLGLDRLPLGPAVLVANHAFGFWDIALAVARIRTETGRTVWGLGEHLWWKVPFVRRLASAVGIVDGTPENADALLELCAGPYLTRSRMKLAWAVNACGSSRY